MPITGRIIEWKELAPNVAKNPKTKLRPALATIKRLDNGRKIEANLNPLTFNLDSIIEFEVDNKGKIIEGSVIKVTEGTIRDIKMWGS